MKITEEKGKKLNLEHLNDSIDFGKIILNAFLDAEREAINQGIEANTIVLSPKYSITKRFWYSLGWDSFYEYPPMLLGKSVILADMLPDDVCFALTKTKVPNIEDLKNEVEFYRNFVKKYIKTDGQSLRVKGISYKKNSDDFRKILSMISDSEGDE